MLSFRADACVSCVTFRHLLAVCGLLMCVSASRADEPEASMWLTVSNRTLDQYRGGFDVGSGLIVSIGISRVVYINDQLVTTTSLQLTDMAKLTSGQLSAMGQQLLASTGQVVQNGPHNSVDPQLQNIPLATYVQNTLDNQHIRVETLIQAVSNGAGLLRSLNLQGVVHAGIAAAIENR